MIVDSFRAAMRLVGIDFAGEILTDGRLHRFRAEGDRRANGWYYLHADDRPFGEFGHHAKGLDRVRWHPREQPQPTTAERAEWRGQREAAERRRQARMAAALVNATREWQAASAARPDHPYLAAKQVQPYGIRQAGENLLIPMRGTTGMLRSIQVVGTDGEKRYRKHLPTKALYHGIGKPAGCIVIAEGYATAASIHECTGHAVAAAFDCANLLHVATALRAKYSRMTLVIAADNDESGAGATGARLAAEAVGCEVRMPELVGEDFNDLAVRAGADAVRAFFPMAIGGLRDAA